MLNSEKRGRAQMWTLSPCRHAGHPRTQALIYMIWGPKDESDLDPVLEGLLVS